MEKRFLLGAFIYPQKSANPPLDSRPCIARVYAETPHLAKRLLTQDILSHGYYVKEIRQLADQLSPFDEEEWDFPGDGME